MPYVTINYKGWDTHKQHFQTMRRKLPEMDQGLATLLPDLADRGLLDSTIVWWGGEFGRTPQVQWEAPWNGGRGHYGACFSAVVAGGGFKGGQVVGASDAKGEEVEDRPVYPRDLIGSMYELLGIDPDGAAAEPARARRHASLPPGPTDARSAVGSGSSSDGPSRRTRVRRWRSLALTVDAAASAARGAPIGYVYPAGGAPGAVLTVTSAAGTSGARTRRPRDRARASGAGSFESIRRSAWFDPRGAARRIRSGADEGAEQSRPGRRTRRRAGPSAAAAGPSPASTGSPISGRRSSGRWRRTSSTGG